MASPRGIWFRYRGDTPIWLWVMLVGLTIVWAVVVFILNRRRTKRVLPASVANTSWQPKPFTLDVYERQLFGVRQRGDIVTLGPSGRQVAGAALLPLLALLVSAVGGAYSSPAARWLTTSAAVALFFTGVAGLRVRVSLTPANLMSRSRFRPIREFSWDGIVDVCEEMRETKIQPRVGTTMATVGILRVAGERPIELPGFRYASWADESSRDDHSSTTLKLNIVRRYRECVVGPWPTEPSSV